MQVPNTRAKSVTVEGEGLVECWGVKNKGSGTLRMNRIPKHGGQGKEVLGCINVVDRKEHFSRDVGMCTNVRLNIMGWHCGRRLGTGQRTEISLYMMYLWFRAIGGLKISVCESNRTSCLYHKIQLSVTGKGTIRREAMVNHQDLAETWDIANLGMQRSDTAKPHQISSCNL